MTSKEKNAHYGRLNNRFDQRAELLRQSGFSYEHVKGYDTAAFVRQRAGRKVYVPAPFVMHADDVCWGDRFREINS